MGRVYRFYKKYLVCIYEIRFLLLVRRRLAMFLQQKQYNINITIPYIR